MSSHGKGKDGESGLMKGLKAAWKALCEQHGVPMREQELEGLVNYARYLLRSRPDKEEAVFDVMQETFRRLCQVKDIDKAKGLAAYASTVIRHYVIDEYNKLMVLGGKNELFEGRQGKWPLSFDDSKVSKTIADETRKLYLAPAAQFEYVSAKETLGKLDSEEQRLLFCLYDTGYNYSLVAERMNLTPAALRKRIERLRTKIEMVSNEKADASELEMKAAD
jgi:RNA polymerase sigma factor (sigma-70 family)